MPRKQAQQAGAEKTGLHISPRNLYRERWMLPLTPDTRTVLNKDRLELRADFLTVRYRFNGGMVYEAGGQKFLLVEQVFGQYPFLLNFALEPQNADVFTNTKLNGAPDGVLAGVRQVCENAAATIKLPENLHNVEVDLTDQVAEKLELPKGWRLAKAIMKVNIGRAPELACVCDVDGPCGYCCDTCDCNQCYNCC